MNMEFFNISMKWYDQIHNSSWNLWSNFDEFVIVCVSMQSLLWTTGPFLQENGKSDNFS